MNLVKLTFCHSNKNSTTAAQIEKEVLLMHGKGLKSQNGFIYNFENVSGT